MDEVSLTSYTTWSDLVGTWKNLDLPNKAWRAEIIDETVVMAPPSGWDHITLISLLHRHLSRTTPDDWGVFERLALQIPQRRCIFVPDLTVVPHAWIREQEYPISARCALLAAEVTSERTADLDRGTKRAVYAQEGIPHYALLDPIAEGGSTAYLYSEPHEDGYRRCRSMTLE